MLLRGGSRIYARALPSTPCKTKTPTSFPSSRIVFRSYADEPAPVIAQKSDKWRVAVILSGCGFLDGSEITESVSTLQHLSRVGAQYECFAPDMESVDVTNHLKGTSDTDEYRMVMDESARISRGKVGRINDLNVADYDALIFPGGYGVAKHLSDYYKGTPEWKVHPEVERLIKAFHANKKPMGFICIAPILAARVLGASTGCRLTIGGDPNVSKQIESMGAKHSVCLVDQIEVDEANLLFSTPAYMFSDATPHDVYRGVGSLVDAMAKKSSVHQAAQVDPFVDKLLKEYLIPQFISYQTKGPARSPNDEENSRR